MAGEGAPRMMSFVSEKEIEDVKKKRQEEWEKARKPSDPVVRPEEVYDPRPLYERLKEQKDRKQEEWEEQFKFKNMIYKGLNDDEAVFLQRIADQKAAYNAEVAMIEREELSAFRQAVAELNEQEGMTQLTTASMATASTGTGTASKRAGSAVVSKPSSSRTQLASLIGSSIKRKRSSSDDGIAESTTAATSPDKKPRLSSSSGNTPDSGGTSDMCSQNAADTSIQQKTVTEKEEGTVKPHTAARTLPGLASYSDSSDEDDV